MGAIEEYGREVHEALAFVPGAGLLWKIGVAAMTIARVHDERYIRTILAQAEVGAAEQSHMPQYEEFEVSGMEGRLN